MMRSKNGLALISISLAILTACGSENDLGNNLSIIDGGGSKSSLAKDGIILIPNTVTGVGRVGTATFVESKGYETAVCEYFVIQDGSDDLIALRNRQATGVGLTIEDAKKVVKSINNRSCLPLHI
jgi:hypothetical protein